MAAIVEIQFAPPIWVHLVLWTPLILGGAIVMLRPFKAGLIALQYRHRLLGGSSRRLTRSRPAMTGFRPQFWPTVFAVPIVLLCLGLGSWQIQRLHWKEGLIAERAAAVGRSARPCAADAAAARGMEFRHVTAEGVFLNDKEIFLGATSEGGVNGYQILTPLREPSGRIVFVDRGFVPAELKDRAEAAGG